MDQPFFSIVIPTRNRSFLAEHAVRSALNQTFRDLEVILVDNDETEATTLMAKQFSDPRFRHVRTGTLNMQDNWERATDEARGRYVCLIEDKQMFKVHAMARLAEEISRHRPDAIRWFSDSFDDSRKPVRFRLAKGDGSCVARSSDELLNAWISHPKVSYRDALPLPQSSCFSAGLLSRIRGGPMGRLFHEFSPDVIMGFLTLAYCDTVLEIREALVVYQSSSHSNGRSLMSKGETGRKFLSQLKRGAAGCFDLTPVKAMTIPGTIYNDFMHTRERVGGRLHSFPVVWTKYFIQCRQAIETSISWGVDMSPELAAWENALAHQSPELQAEVRKIWASSIGRSGGFMKRAGDILRVDQAARYFKHWFRGKIQGDPEWRFASPQEYIEWEARRVR